MLLMNYLVSSTVAIILLAVSLLLLIPCVVICIECLLASLPASKPLTDANLSRPRITVLVPAHNEAIGIKETLSTILPQLTSADRLIVIADNCNDETAAIAESAGATVIVRQDSQHRGKGYALDFGLRSIEADPPDVVVVVDADCTVETGAIDKISRLANNQLRPVQAAYLLTRSGEPKPKDAVSLLAFTVKNLVRPLGLAYLKLPCLLTGTGMAFPWAVLQQVSLASGDIVEDMKLSLDLAIAGYPPMLCSEARVIGVLPQQAQASKNQRTRWEHGHLRTLLNQVPRLIQAAIKQRRFDLFAIALDQCVPPLSLLVVVWGVVTTVALVYRSLSGFLAPVLLLGLEGVFILISVVVAWAKFSRDYLPLTTLLFVPLYILWKIPLYFKFLINPQTKWIRTERDLPGPSKS